MHVSILTLFPQMFVGPLDYSIVKRAKDKGIINIHFINPRDFATDKYKSVDNHPYGGGLGMILRVDIMDKAIQKAKAVALGKTRVILLDPRGPTYTQRKANDLTTYDHLILICGHYEGFDERIRSLIDEEISVGDYILTGGELPAMMIIDSVTRLLPGVLTHPEGTKEESFSEILEHPQYTRPEEYKGMKVPDILSSGDHKKIHMWKKEQAIKITKKHRPDLLP